VAAFFDAGGRDVTPDGVELVMDMLLRLAVEGVAAPRTPDTTPDVEAQRQAIADALAADCDEIMARRGYRPARAERQSRPPTAPQVAGLSRRLSSGHRGRRGA